MTCLLRLIVLGASFVFFVATAYAEPPAKLVGSVHGAAEPLVGATISITGESLAEPMEIQTDADGRFELTLPPGSYSLTFAADGFEGDWREVELTAGGREALAIELLEPQIIEVLAAGEKAPPEMAKRSLSTREMARLPGTRGDALRSVQSLPGVARVPGGVGLLMVRGSAPQDTQTFVDGTNVPLIYHFGGLSSVIPTELIDHIDFYPGNFSARYGRGQGGIVEAGFRAPRLDRIGAMAEVNLIDARALAEGPIPYAEDWSFAVAGRRSVLDAWIGPALDAAGARATQVPTYYDYQLIVQNQPDPRSTFRTAFFGSDDGFELRLRPTLSNPTRSGNFDLHTAFQRLQLRYEHLDIDGRGSQVSATLAGGHDLVDVGIGPLFANLEIWTLTSRLELAQRLSRGVTLRVGTDLRNGTIDGRLRLPTPGGANGPSATRLTTTQTLSRDFNLPGAYVELELSKGAARVVPGFRIDYVSLLDTVDVSPRVTFQHDLRRAHPRTTAKAGLGVYRQPPDYPQMIGPFANPELKTNRSMHYGLGVEQGITKQLEASVDLFFKQMDQQVDREPLGSGQGQFFYDNATRGHVVGGELLLKYKADKYFFGWLAYTLSRSVRTNRPGRRERQVSFDQPHILTVVGSLRLGGGWELGMRFRLVSGNLVRVAVCDPNTPTCDEARINGVFHGPSGTYVPVESRLETERLPTFHQLDLRIDKRWMFDEWQLSAYLDVANVYNQQNTEGYSFDFDFTAREPIVGLPILPSIGLRAAY